MRRALVVGVLILGLGACGAGQPETVPPETPPPTTEPEQPEEAPGPIGETEAAETAEAPAETPEAPAPAVPPEAVEIEVEAGHSLAVAAGLGERYDSIRVRADPLARRDFQPEDYWGVLLPIVDSDPGRFRVRTVGESILGRPIRRIDFGNGDTTVLLWSQMHGDESTASRALVDVLAFLAGAEDDPLVERIESELSLTFVPVLNPDGAALFSRHNAIGVDVNRDARRLATPEGRTLKAIRDDVDADWGFNLHDQNVRTRLGGSGRDVLIALLAPPPGPGETSPANRRARRMCSLLAAALEPAVGDQVARYDESFNPRAFGDLMAAWGTSTVLIESGGELADPDKSRLRKANFMAIVTALEAIATGAWRLHGEERYLDLPLNSAWIYDLVVRDVRVVLPGRAPVTADLAINFADPLTRQDGRIQEVGDLDDAEGLEMIAGDGLYFHPTPAALGSDGQLGPGTRATGTLTRDPAGARVVYRLESGRLSRPDEDASTR